MPGIKCSINQRQRGAPVDSSQPAGIAMGGICSGRCNACQRWRTPARAANCVIDGHVFIGNLLCCLPMPQLHVARAAAAILLADAFCNAQRRLTAVGRAACSVLTALLRAVAGILLQRQCQTMAAVAPIKRRSCHEWRRPHPVSPG